MASKGGTTMTSGVVVPNDRLEAMAVKHGQEPSYIRAAVNKGWLRPAQPERLPWGKLVWNAPDENEPRLRAVLALRTHGFRGGAIYYRLWWLGYLTANDDHFPEVKEYVLRSLWEIRDLTIGLFRNRANRDHRRHHRS